MINENEMENINIGDWILYIWDHEIMLGVVIREPEMDTPELMGGEGELMVITNLHKVTRSEILEVRKA